MVRQATDTAVSASISTPVWPPTFTSAETRSPVGSREASNSTVAFVIASGWQSGINSCVFFAAMMPAMRAVASTSPFLAVPVSMSASVSGPIVTKPSARAVRCVTALSDTSTMRASPFSLRWLSLVMGRHQRPLPTRGRGTRSALVARPQPSLRSGAEQRAGGGGDVGLPHQALADQERMHARLREPLEVGMAVDAALGDDDAVLRHPWRQLLGRLKRGVEGLQVAIVDADQAAVEHQRAIE